MGSISTHGAVRFVRYVPPAWILYSIIFSIGNVTSGDEKWAARRTPNKIAIYTRLTYDRCFMRISSVIDVLDRTEFSFSEARL